MKVYGFLSIVSILVAGLSFVSSRSNEASSTENDIFVRSVRATSEDDSVKKEDGSTFRIRTTVFFFIYGFLVLLAFIGFLVWRLRRSKLKAQNNNSYVARFFSRISSNTYSALQNIYNGMRDTGEAVPEELRDCPVHEQLRTHYMPYKKKYEISNENLEKKKYLGKGNFGVVRMGLLKMADPKTEEEEKKRLTVALKSAANCYDITQTSMLADELRLMCAIGRFPNVLALVGAVTVELRRGRLLIVTEFIDCGDLHSYLKVHKDIFEDHLVEDRNEKDEPDSYLTPLSAKRKTYLYTKEGGEQEEVIKESLKSLTTSDLLSFGLQIANGMQYLATIPLVHRDLALRNVLLKNNKTVRIADFGMARIHQTSSYYRTKKTKDAPIPVRWMSPEAVDNMIFTQQSDVWSYGICLYELFTLGGLPYPEIKTDDVYDYMKAGRRCSQPEHCHVELYNLMKLCWNMKPELRPTFSVIVEYFIEHMKNSAPQLLDYVEKMLKVEADNQRQLDDWIRTPQPVS
ncbi:CBN-KIN-16 protein [Caenorhabditis brenneri]|uniref:CBN-KIN-16 protein n=1 Tax=Caenorhabditis brenneri TaxID=135651 RepID=G0NAH2_CAEBE|nr:CBN-KIN-16 protein [Caenorhabditis brenneri]